MNSKHEAGHAKPVDPVPSVGGGLEAVEGNVKDLAARVDELEQRVAATASLPIQAEATGVAEPAAGPTRLQDVLPDIKELSEKVGGLEQLSRIIDTLKQAKECATTTGPRQR